jgi:hypothetical protein
MDGLVALAVQTGTCSPVDSSKIAVFPAITLNYKIEDELWYE